MSTIMERSKITQLQVVKEGDRYYLHVVGAEKRLTTNYPYRPARAVAMESLASATTKAGWTEVVYSSATDGLRLRTYEVALVAE